MLTVNVLYQLEFSTSIILKFVSS